MAGSTQFRPCLGARRVSFVEDTVFDLQEPTAEPQAKQTPGTQCSRSFLSRSKRSTEGSK